MAANSEAVNRGAVDCSQGGRPPRGDYAQAGSDYTCTRRWQAYSEKQHALYRGLHHWQTAQLPALDCEEFIDAVHHLGAGERIARFHGINDKLCPSLRWQVVAVLGLILEAAFFALLAMRRFRSNEWLGELKEFDDMVEPDVFQGVFGRVPLLFNPNFADEVQADGEGGLEGQPARRLRVAGAALLVPGGVPADRHRAGLRAYGNGALSSAGELRYSAKSAQPWLSTCGG